MKRLLGLTIACLAATSWASISGDSWPKPYPKYRVFRHSAVNGITNFDANILPRIQAGFLNWTALGSPAVSCTDLTMTYDGPVRLRNAPTAQQPDAGILTEPADQYVPSLNGYQLFTLQDSTNNIAFIDSKWSDGSGTLGVTIRATIVGQNNITDADMRLNNNNVTWSNNGAFNTIDLESVVHHEAGHFIGIDHTQNIASVMYPSVGPGEIKRTNAQIDIQEVCQVYPGSPGAQGYACTTSSVCTGGRVCRGLAAGGSKICTVDCSSGQACPMGYTCENADTGKACLVAVGASDLCKFCTSANDCVKGNCFSDGWNRWCTTSCTDSSQCGPGYFCGQPQGGGGGICAPNNGCTNQCSAQNPCPVDFECVNGACEPRGNPGDGCGVSEYCKNCNLCITDSQTGISTCRACCTGGTGQYCSGCMSTTCSSGTACLGLSGTSEKVCYPSTGAGICQSCSASTPCAQGTCVAGRCHTTCNPSNPGSCQACSPTSSTTGYCACTNEIANAGQPCGTSNGFPACRTGLVCSGPNGSKACRKLCTLGNNATCSAGEVCALTDGNPICVTGQQPGQRCNPCGSGCAAGLTCHQGRCYEPCNTGAATCNSCVGLVAGGGGVCACDDQRSAVNGPCSSDPVLACQPGLTCLDGFCRAECNPAVPNACGPGLECRLTGSVGLCQMPSSDGGGMGGGNGNTGGGTGGVGGGGSDATGGAPPFPVIGGGEGGGGDPGQPNTCGCGQGNGGGFALGLMALMAVAWRSRKRAVVARARSRLRL